MEELSKNSAMVREMRSQRGAILIVAIGLLVMMSMLGFFALNMADVELRIAGNYRARQQAFYAADRAVAYALANPAIYAEIGLGSVELADAHATQIAADTGSSGLKAGESSQVSYLDSGALPPDCGSDPTYFQVRIYAIQAVTEGPGGATARVEAQVARVVPR
jgi:Tfp pilus assembly protein PilX